jgi:hypothetical protein
LNKVVYTFVVVPIAAADVVDVVDVVVIYHDDYCMMMHAQDDHGLQWNFIKKS